MSRVAVLAVQTAPARPLERTLASLERAGLSRWSGPRVLAADGCRPQIPGWDLRCSESVHGSARTMLRLLRIVAAEYPALDLYYFEDDVVLARNALDHMIRVLAEGSDAIYWFQPAHRPGSRGWRAWRAVGGWCATKDCAPHLAPIPEGYVRKHSQALFLPAATVRRLASRKVPWNHPRLHRLPHRLMLLYPALRAVVHFPNIVQHVGGWKHRSESFIGEDADAMELTWNPSP